MDLTIAQLSAGFWRDVRTKDAAMLLKTPIESLQELDRFEIVEGGDFRYFNFLNEKLAGKCFLNCNFEGASFHQRALAQVVFNNCKLSHTNFAGCNLINCRFRGCHGEKTDFTLCSFEKNCNLEQSTLMKAKLVGASSKNSFSMVGSRLIRPTIRDCKIVDANLFQLAIQGGEVYHNSFTYCEWKGVTLVELKYSAHNAVLPEDMHDQEVHNLVSLLNRDNYRDYRK